MLLAVLLLLPLRAAAFSDHSLSVQATLSEDGRAHVTEKTVFFVRPPAAGEDESADEKNFKTALASGKSTVLEWKPFSQNIGYHVGGVAGSIEGLRISAGTEQSISYYARFVALDYDITNPVVSSTQENLVDSVTGIRQNSGRTTRYSLNSDFLGFKKSEVGQTVLGQNTVFSVKLPKSARMVSTSGDYDKESRTVSWSGPVTVYPTVLYEIEEPLSEEVYRFFADAYLSVVQLAPLALALFLAAIVAAVFVKFRKH